MIPAPPRMPRHGALCCVVSPGAGPGCAGKRGWHPCRTTWLWAQRREVLSDPIRRVALGCVPSWLGPHFLSVYSTAGLLMYQQTRLPKVALSGIFSLDLVQPLRLGRCTHKNPKPLIHKLIAPCEFHELKTPTRGGGVGNASPKPIPHAMDWRKPSDLTDPILASDPIHFLDWPHRTTV